LSKRVNGVPINFSRPVELMGSGMNAESEKQNCSRIVSPREKILGEPRLVIYEVRAEYMFL